MFSPFKFAKIPYVQFGIGSFSSLGKTIANQSKYILLVTRKTFLQSTKGKELLEQFAQLGISYEHLTVKGEPTAELINKATAQYAFTNIGAVVGIGGGSVVDAGKAISAMLPVGKPIEVYLEGVGVLPPPGLKTPYIAVPTTAGTGSEATKNAVICNIGSQGFKKSLRHDNYVPDYVVIDPQLSTSCPPAVTAASGMDAFIQLLEAYVSPKASLMTDGLVFEALQLAAANLSVAYHQPNNLEARSAMAYAAFISGICLANAGLGIVHGIASPIGGFFGIPHGVVCGTLMGEATRINIKALQEQQPNSPALAKFAKVGALFANNTKATDAELHAILLKQIGMWLNEFNIEKLSAYGIGLQDVDRIVAGSSNKDNPIALNKEQIAEIITARL